VRGADTDRVLAVCGVLVSLGSLIGLATRTGPVSAPVASVLASIAGGLAVAFARRRPTAAMLGFSLSLFIAVLLGSELDQQNGALTLPFFLLPVFWAANTDHRTFVRSLPFVVVLFPLGFVIDDPSQADSSIVFVLLIPLGLGAAGGRLLHWHTEAARRLERQAQELAANRDARAAAAVTAERSRIARDLHDLIAHDVSVMVVQAQAAERLTRTDAAGAGSAIAQIEQTGRDALSEMRRSRCARSPRCAGSWPSWTRSARAASRPSSRSRGPRSPCRRASTWPPTGSSATDCGP
jgi:signal transduction histidine kinase